MISSCDSEDISMWFHAHPKSIDTDFALGISCASASLNLRT